MIKFFRRIRQKLLSENKISSYLIYATGEIVLVMIGILLALQVNNWNENRKLKSLEIDLLESLKSDLINNKLELERTVFSFQKGANQHRLILKYIEEDLSYERKLDTAFSRITIWATPYFRNSTYETLKSKGIDIIDNKALKNEIIKMYDYDFHNIVNDWDRTLWLYAESISYPITNKTVQTDLDSHLARPIDFEQLKTNTEFKNMLAWLTYNNEVSVQYLNSVIVAVDKLISNIDIEIKEFKE